MASGRNFTEDSARDTSLAVQEAQAWIEVRASPALHVAHHSAFCPTVYLINKCVHAPHTKGRH